MHNDLAVENIQGNSYVHTTAGGMNLFALASALIRCCKDVYEQKKYIRKHIAPFLSSLEHTCGGTISKYQKNKILSSYAVLVPSILGANYRRLYDQAFTEKDRWSVTMTGVITPIADDMFDVEQVSVECLSALTFDPEAKAETFSEKLFTAVNGMLMDTAVDKNAYLAILHISAQTQIDSLKQYDANTSKQELEHVTYAKASAAFRYYHIHMMGNPSSEVADVLYQIAGLQQMSNDIFDIYNDWNEKIYTLANTCSDFSVFKDYFLKKVRIQNQKIMQLPYEQKNKKHFALIMQLIEARALVAIDHFISLEKQHGKNLQWSIFERKDLVVDIQKTGNFIKWLNNVRKLNQLY